MTHVQNVAPADPLAALTRNLGQDVADLQRLLVRVDRLMAHVDEKRAQLRETYQVSFDVDLGDVWNNAMAARRQLEVGAVRPSFSLPKGQAA